MTDGCQAFTKVCHKGNVNMLKLLLNESDQLGLDVNAQDSIGETALMVAVKFGHQPLIRLILDSKIDDLSARDKWGWTAFMWACRGKIKCREMIELLMEKSPKDLNCWNNKGDSAFSLACQYNTVEVITLIIEKSSEFQIDLNAKNVYGETAFFRACNRNMEGNSDMISVVQLLLEKSGPFNIDLNSKNYRGYTPFMACSCLGNEALVELLMDRASSLGINLEIRPGMTQ